MKTLTVIFISSVIFVAAIQAQPIDSKATKETVALFKNLKKLSENHTLFAHQHATEYGHGWYGDENRSDVKSVCGSHPAMAVSYTHLRAHETVLDLVCRLLLEKKKKK